MNNSLKAGIEEMENYLRKSIPWSMKDFDLAKEELYRQYPTGMDLWKAIDKINI